MLHRRRRGYSSLARGWRLVADVRHEAAFKYMVKIGARARTKSICMSAPGCATSCALVLSPALHLQPVRRAASPSAPVAQVALAGLRSGRRTGTTIQTHSRKQRSRPATSSALKRTTTRPLARTSAVLLFPAAASPSAWVTHARACWSEEWKVCWHNKTNSQ